MSDIQVYDKLIELSDEHLEQIVLQKYFLDSDYFSVINDYFESRFFTNLNVQKIYNILQRYYKKYSQMPTPEMLELIFDKFKKQDPEITTNLKREFQHVSNLKIKHSKEYIKDNVIRFIKHKRAYFSFMDHIDGVTIKGDVSECLSDFQKILSITFDDDLGFDYFTDHHKHRTELTNPELKIATQYSQLDKVTFGGIPKIDKCLFVLIAQPGLGKSMFMSNLAVNFLHQGLFPIIISLEMSEKMYASRIDAHISSLNINELRYKIDDLKDKIEGFQTLNKDAKLVLKEYPPNSISTAHIQNYIDKVINKQNRKPDVIIVDYINLLQSNNGQKGQGMYERVGDVTRELRALSYKYNCPVITASQVNRSAINTSDVNMDNVSESMGIAHTADFIGALWQQEGDLEACRMNMKILKNRLGGMVGINIQFHINYNTLRITDITDVEETSKTPNDGLLTDLEGL